MSDKDSNYSIMAQIVVFLNGCIVKSRNGNIFSVCDNEDHFMCLNIDKLVLNM